MSSDIACQTDLDIDGMTETSKKTVHRLNSKISRRKKALPTLQDRYDEARECLRAYDESKEIQRFRSVLAAAEQGEKAALFIENQVGNFHAKKPTYSESILRECVLWKACSNKGYDLVRSGALFKLPCRTTLQKYVGKSTGEPHGQQEEPFYGTDDERLSWLEVDFVNYIEDLQLSGGRSKQKITKETYEAMLLTTRSTVPVTEYLLDHARFRYVLTRGFNSDSVESFFSCLRQFNSGNDRVDARAAVFFVEKLLKVGILHAAKTGNAPSSSESSVVVSLPAQDSDVPALRLAIRSAVREFQASSSTCTVGHRR
ncbi:hypothetical protein MTO96_025113 [Rhipicephalus appendiculatus]